MAVWNSIFRLMIEGFGLTQASRYIMVVAVGLGDIVYTIWQTPASRGVSEHLTTLKGNDVCKH